jgi:hypothetical protein
MAVIAVPPGRAPPQGCANIINRLLDFRGKADFFTRMKKTLFLGLLLVLPVLARAQDILLLINDSNPAAVTITATANNATVINSNTTLYDGSELLGFFTTALPGNYESALSSGTLTPSGNDTLPYESYYVDDYSGGNVDLNLYYYGSGPSDPNENIPQQFSTLLSAYTGTATADLSNESLFLPAAGAQGNVLSGWSGNVGAVIGQWQVVPEPANAGLTVGLGALAVVFVGLATRRRAAVIKACYRTFAGEP